MYNVIRVYSRCVELDKNQMLYMFSPLSLTCPDINSQFISKGPIHKLLNQLAIRFEHLDLWNVDGKFQNKKRTRSQACPAYILNLSCPRSLYDLTFEPSMTCVQFKVVSLAFLIVIIYYMNFLLAYYRFTLPILVLLLLLFGKCHLASLLNVQQ